MFIAQVPVEQSKQLKQIIQTEHNIAKNPKWPETNQLAIYKLCRGFESGATKKQIHAVVGGTRTQDRRIASPAL